MDFPPCEVTGVLAAVLPLRLTPAAPFGGGIKRINSPFKEEKKIKAASRRPASCHWHWAKHLLLILKVATVRPLR